MASEVQTQMITAADGRELCVEIAGAPSERALIVLAGTPNSRHLFAPWIGDAAARGVALIGYDRPGYGRSTPQPDHSVADAAADVRTIAEQLGIERLGIWGYSGGGPYALACAALLPELVAAAAVVGSPAPWRAPGLDYFDGMGADNVEELQLYLSDPQAARRKARKIWEDEITVTPEQLTEAWQTLLSPVDAAVLTGDFARYVADCIHDGLAPGEQGWWDDGVAHMAPWGFELGAIELPVQVWHGRHDRFVPFQHGQYLTDQIPTAEPYLSDTDGHLTLLVERYAEIHAWLLAHL